jgi:hypothetical protein
MADVQRLKDAFAEALTCTSPVVEKTALIQTMVLLGFSKAKAWHLLNEFTEKCTIVPSDPFVEWVMAQNRPGASVAAPVVATPVEAAPKVQAGSAEGTGAQTVVSTRSPESLQEKLSMPAAMGHEKAAAIEQLGHSVADIWQQLPQRLRQVLRLENNMVALPDRAYSGDVALTVAVQEGVPLEVLDWLLLVCVDSAPIVGEILHILLKKSDVEWKAVTTVVKSHPDAAKAMTKDHMLPLHLALKAGAPLEVLQLFLAACPEAVKEKDGQSLLPLHWAVQNQATMDIVHVLLAAYPDAAKETDKNQTLPLHFAAQKGASLEVVEALLAAYPEAAKENDKDSKLPLQYALGNAATLEVVEALLAAYPEAMKEKDGSSKLPLHYAVVKGAALEVVQLLLAAYPEAAKEKDLNSTLPLY